MRPPDELFRAVRDTDPDCLDVDQIPAYLADVARLRAWCDARQIRAVHRQRQLADQGRAPDPRASLARHGRQSDKDAKAADARERVCGAMPGFEDALNNGAVAAGHVDAIATATARLDEQATAEFIALSDELLRDAERQGVDTFARNCRELARSIQARRNAQSDVDELESQKAQSKISRWTDKVTGMCHTHIEADPISDRIIWTAIQHERARLRQHHQHNRTSVSWDRLNIDSLVAAITTGGSSERRPEIVVHIDVDTLTNGRHEGTLCETDSGAPLPVATVRRMACDADIIPVVLNGNGVALDVGRSRRLATVEQRTAIAAMQTTCAHPDCTVSIDDCRIHHLNPWKPGGLTNLDNLIGVCEVHHHLVHEKGWTLTMTPDRVATWTQPDGQHYWTGPTNTRGANEAKSPVPSLA